LLVNNNDIGHFHEPQTWPRQSLLAAQGRWVDLEALKDELNNGKIV